MPLQVAISAPGPVIVSAYFDRVGDYDGVLLVLGALALVSIAIVLVVPDPQARRPAVVPPAVAPAPPLAATPPARVATPEPSAAPPRGSRQHAEGARGRRLPMLVASALGVWLVSLIVPAIAGSRRR